ncbi:MAG TPA: hypothetical protein VGG31_06010 [Candidatus Dormibacteraeota bacterium]
MSEQDDDLELRALKRELDDAFATTRPRRGFEDELWLRMQARRPLGSRLRDALGGLVQGIRAVPAVPTAAVAGLLVVVLGIGVLALSGVGRGGNAASTAGSAFNQGDTNHPPTLPGAFGRLPSPRLGSGSSAPPLPAAADPRQLVPGSGYVGPVNLTWAGKLTLDTPTLPVFRYHEPSTNAADQFASALGAVMQSRPGGLLGEYESSDYTLSIRGTVQAPAAEPTFVITAGPSMPEINAAGAAPSDIATLFLAEHSLVPQWPYTADVQSAGGASHVRLLRQFVAGPYGLAYLVDPQGDRYGLEVDLAGNKPTMATGPLPVTLEAASYPVISDGQAIGAALGSSAGGPGAPTVQLSQAEVVYVVVAAGDHSFYEPAFLFSGSFTVNGHAYLERILVPAVDPSQRSS